MYKNKFAKVLNIKMGEKGKMKKKWGTGKGEGGGKYRKGD